MSSMSVSEARAALPALLDRVELGEEVTITRHGRAVAVLVGPEALRTRRRSEVFSAADELHELIERAGRQPIPQTGLSVERADELVREIRADRDAGR